MLDVASLQKFEFLDKFRLAAGSSGIFRNVTNVVILDYEGIEEDYSGFHEGDFVITNLMFAKKHPERIYNSFKSLIEIGVSAFAVKTIFFTELPDEVIRLADERQTPVFLFNDIYIEDVILNITDYLRSSANYNYYQNIIDTFLQTPDNSSRIAELLKALSVRETAEMTSSMYLSCKEALDEFTLQRTINRLQIRLQHTSASHDLKVIKYGNGIIFLKFYNDSTSLPVNFRLYWTNLLKELSVDESSFHIGINDTALPLSKLDISIKRSIYACRCCRKSLSGICTYSELGYRNIIYSLSDNAYAAEYLTEIIEKIQPDCDTLSGFKKSDIYPTLKACVDNDFDIAKAAEVLFQHPNTIRYRLRKTKEALQIDDEMTFRILVTILVSL